MTNKQALLIPVATLIFLLLLTCQALSKPLADSPCMPYIPICTISGSAGEIVECPFILAGESQTISNFPSGMDFSLVWDQQLVAVENISDDFCTSNGTCFPFDLWGYDNITEKFKWQNLSPSGHSVIAVPNDLASWQGWSTLLFFSMNNTPLTTTVLQNNDQFSDGSEVLFSIKLKLLANINPASPTFLNLASGYSITNQAGSAYNLKARDIAGKTALLISGPTDPQAQVCYEPDTLTFLNTPIASTSPSQTVKIFNSGTGPMTITNLGINLPRPFTLNSADGTFPIGRTPAFIPASKYRTISITYRPTLHQTTQASLLLTTKATILTPTTLTMTGSALTPKLSDIILILQAISNRPQSQACSQIDINGDGQTGLPEAIYLLGRHLLR